MKTVFRLIALMVHIAVLVFVIQNWQVPVSMHYGQLALVNVSLGYVALKCYVLGLVMMGLEFYMAQRRTANQMKQWELRREKAEVQAETQTDQVQALESKIRTLEKALETALASKQKDA